MVAPKHSDQPAAHLEQLARDLSEGRVVDWDRAENQAGSEEERSWIRNLRVVNQVSELARSEDPSQILRDMIGGVAAGRGASAADQDERTIKTEERDLRAAAAGESKETSVGTETWGSLQLLEKVGSGAFGDVYRAWDPMLNRQVALKLMQPAAQRQATEAARAEGAPTDTAALAKVLEEARMLARVEHPHVARIYGVEEHEGCFGIWMEFVQGTDLRSVARERGHFDADEAARVGHELCGALEAVHAANVIHKDIKPQNVMLRPDGSTVLMDFGAGRGRSAREGQVESVIAGTPRYMAPEIFRREPATPQADLYSLGAMLYNLVTGAYPVDGTIPEIIRAHEDGRRTGLAERAPELPAEFVAIVEKALAPQRTDRFASAAAMGEALAAFRAARQGASRSGVVGRISRVSRRTWIAAAAAVVVMAVGGTLLKSALTPPPPLSADVRFSGVVDGISKTFAPGDLVTNGDAVEASVRLSRDAYVYVLNRDSEGNTVVLFPMASDPRGNRLAGGREHAIPGEIGGERKRWALGGAEGRESFLVIASIEPLAEFEAALTEVAAIDIGGGMDVRAIGDLALGSLAEATFQTGENTRGVVGLVGGGDEETDIFAMAELLASEGTGDGEVYLYHMSLRKSRR